MPEGVKTFALATPGRAWWVAHDDNTPQRFVVAGSEDEARKAWDAKYDR